MAEAVDDFHKKFKETYSRLKKKHIEQLRTHESFAKKTECNTNI